MSDSSEEENKGHILKKRILEKLDMIITTASLVSKDIEELCQSKERSKLENAQLGQACKAATALLYVPRVPRSCNLESKNPRMQKQVWKMQGNALSWR